MAVKSTKSGMKRIVINGKFTFSRKATWKLINWRKCYNNFVDTSAMLRAFPRDSTSTRFRVTSLAG